MEIKIEGLTKVFMDQKHNKTVAVNDLNLTIPSGKLIGLLGPSGCGKSTTLYMIAGLHKVTSGKIFFGSKDVTDIPPEKREIGLVFQNYALYPHMTVAQNIMFPLDNKKGLTKAEKQERALEAAKIVGIEMLMNRKPKELSGGQQQRVAIARALVKRPAVLLLDEPLSNLDARLRLQTREEIKRIQRETGITTIFVTHDQEEAMSISDEIVVMKLGIVQQVDEPQHVYDEPQNQFVAQFLGTPAINIFEGYLKSNALYVQGKMIARTGFKASKELDLTGEDAYPAAVEGGYEGSYEAYHSLTEEKSDKEIFEALARSGYKLKEEDLFAAWNKIRAEKCYNRPVNIGVRPESFVLDDKGNLPVDVTNIEHIGRDMSIVGHITDQGNRLRIIISSENREAIGDKTHLMFKAKKYFVFEKDGTRIK